MFVHKSLYFRFLHVIQCFKCMLLGTVRQLVCDLFGTLFYVFYIFLDCVFLINYLYMSLKESTSKASFLRATGALAPVESLCQVDLKATPGGGIDRVFDGAPVFAYERPLKQSMNGKTPMF